MYVCVSLGPSLACPYVLSRTVSPSAIRSTSSAARVPNHSKSHPIAPAALLDCPSGGHEEIYGNVTRGIVGGSPTHHPKAPVAVTTWLGLVLIVGYELTALYRTGLDWIGLDCTVLDCNVM